MELDLRVAELSWKAGNSGGLASQFDPLIEPLREYGESVLRSRAAVACCVVHALADTRDGSEFDGDVQVFDGRPENHSAVRDNGAFLHESRDVGFLAVSNELDVFMHGREREHGDFMGAGCRQAEREGKAENPPRIAPFSPRADSLMRMFDLIGHGGLSTPAVTLHERVGPSAVLLLEAWIRRLGLEGLDWKAWRRSPSGSGYLAYIMLPNVR